MPTFIDADSLARVFWGALATLAAGLSYAGWRLGRWYERRSLTLSPRSR